MAERDAALEARRQTLRGNKQKALVRRRNEENVAWAKAAKSNASASSATGNVLKGVEMLRRPSSSNRRGFIAVNVESRKP